MTAPTGIGKTLTSMNFALHLRKLIEKEKKFIPRIVYVAPFISILDQNMEVFQNVFQIKNQKEQQRQQQTNLLLMHHHLAPINYYSTDAVEQEQKRETYSTSQSELLIQGWNAEIIVTTFVQFFNTIFGRYASQLRRLHNLIGSIIILDEIQSIPFEYWDAVRNALLFLSKKYHFTIIMMTATQPLIFKQDEQIELSPDEIQTIPQRVAFHPRNQKGLNIQDFCMEVYEIIKGHPKQSVLVEVNTISNAKEVFNGLSSSLGDNRILFFLSAQIIPKHRKPRIHEIKERLRNSEPLVLVSTQVVEAGVDLDFNIAIRDIGPIDSIIQTSGRCNRNGKRKDSDSPFYIYRIVNDKETEFAKQVYGKVSIDIANDLVSKSANVLDLLQSYYTEIKSRRSSIKSNKVNAAISELNYEEAGEIFQLIDQDYRLPVFVEIDEDASKVWHDFVNLTSSSPKSMKNEIRHQMEQYMIGVSEKDVEILSLEVASDIYKVDRKDIGNFYNETIGFVHLYQK